MENRTSINKFASKIILFIFFVIFFQSCYSQDQKQFYSKDFKWRIDVPENFTSVSSQEWIKLQNKGNEAIEKTYNTKIENNTKTIFVFKSDKFNYFESNFQPFDIEVNGDYLQSCKNVNEILYETFKTQIQGAKIDTLTSKEIISNLTFQVFKIKIIYPNNMILHCEMYSRLFDKKEFSVNIMFVDEKKGRLMSETWKNSVFE